MTSWSLTMGPPCTQKSTNGGNIYDSFQWKLKGDRSLILIYLDNLMVIFDFGHLQEVNWGLTWTENSKLWVLLKFSVKTRAFQNFLNSICTTTRTICGQNVSSIWHCLLKLLSLNPPPRPKRPKKEIGWNKIKWKIRKWGQLGPQQISRKWNLANWVLNK